MRPIERRRCNSMDDLRERGAGPSSRQAGAMPSSRIDAREIGVIAGAFDVVILRQNLAGDRVLEHEAHPALPRPLGNLLTRLAVLRAIYIDRVIIGFADKLRILAVHDSYAVLVEDDQVKIAVDPLAAVF